MESTCPQRSVKDLVEGLLFLAEEPLSLNRLAESLPHTREEIAAALDALQAEYRDRGLELRFVAGGWQITTDPALGDEIERFFNLQRRRRLSKQALETLAVIAYNQPITRSEIEAVRGVQTTGTLQTLQECDLIRVVGQADTLGNPYLYGTTDQFLRHFGLGTIAELPPLEFEREGLVFPKRVDGGTDGESDETKVTSIEFGYEVEADGAETHVKQKGA